MVLTFSIVMKWGTTGERNELVDFVDLLSCRISLCYRRLDIDSARLNTRKRRERRKGRN